MRLANSRLLLALLTLLTASIIAEESSILDGATLVNKNDFLKFITLLKDSAMALVCCCNLPDTSIMKFLNPFLKIINL